MNQLCANAADYFQSIKESDLTNSKGAFLIEEATAIDTEHESWIAQVPTSSHPREERNKRNGTRLLTHNGMILPAVYNLYRSSRVVLHEFRLRCATTLGSQGGQRSLSPEQNYDASVWESASTIRVVAEDIRASVPFCLGDVDENGFTISEPLRPGVLAGAYLLLWPLLVVRLATCTTKEQREFATSTLERIGNEFGIKQALELLQRYRGLFET